MNYSISQALKANVRLLTVVVVLLVCVSHVFFVEGVRGTDQYWYLADVETLANDLPPLTNTVFPGDVLRTDNAEQTTYFAHNGPLLDIVSWVTRLTEPAFAWKYVNLFFFLLAALFTGLTVASLSSIATGYASAIVFLVTPINVWLSGNFLQEMFFCSLSAAILYCAVSNDRQLYKRLILIGAIMLGTMSHPLYLIVGVCYALFVAVYRQQWVFALTVICTVFLASALKGAWFPTSFPPSIKQIVSASLPGGTNSLWQLSDTELAITAQFLFSKLLYALKNQFLPSSQSPLYLATNIGLIALVALMLNFRRTSISFLFISAIFMLSYAGMIVLMQNQARYQLFVTPAAVACTVLWLSTWRQREVVTWLAVLLLAGYLVIDSSMLRKIRSDAIDERDALTSLSGQLSFIGPDTKVAMVGNTLGGWLSVVYALRPARSMPVFLNVLDDGKFAKVLTLFQPDFILVRDKLSIDDVQSATFMMSLENPGLFDFDVYEIVGSGE